MKTDITHHSDSELSLMVFNDEGLYRMRKSKRALMEILNEYFIYNNEQLAELEADLEADEVDDE